MKQNIKKVPSLKEQVYNYLKQALLNNEFELGKLYSDQWVAGQLGVSRTPVREAVQQLKHEGFVKVVPYKGFTAKTISEKEIEEVFEAREAIEGFCIKKLVNNHQSRAAGHVRQKLEEIIAGQETSAQNNERNKFWEMDSNFHQCIVNYSDNTILVNLYQSLGDKISRIALETLKENNRLTTALQEHKKTLEFINKEELLEAYESNYRHLLSTKALMMEALKKCMDSNS
ncbi:GntR family transcriptional regulator [Metallumcola ferriviriculae]|uniref:GntR family transcriptional regulator n=1 Tax=Metallumcola ferriviriculae TaxID=3039180 RepID=A0AAU0UN23_9FIRM|nr:GntR family transcriptional regulator [Desulfitibacteraceae bacterium MK1]